LLYLCRFDEAIGEGFERHSAIHVMSLMRMLSIVTEQPSIENHLHLFNDPEPCFVAFNEKELIPHGMVGASDYTGRLRAFNLRRVMFNVFKLKNSSQGCRLVIAELAAIRTFCVEYESLQHSNLLLRRIFLSFNRYRLNGESSNGQNDLDPGVILLNSWDDVIAEDVNDIYSRQLFQP